jgi:hypothetical protein
MSERVNAKEYGKLHGVSDVAVLKWIKSGKLGPKDDAWSKSGKNWAIDVQKADAYYRDLARETNQARLFGVGSNSPPAVDDTQPGSAVTPPALNLNTRLGADAWRAKYEALRSQLEYERATGKYILLDDTRKAVFSILRALRDTTLNLPDRVTPIVTAENDEDKVRKILTDEITAAHNETVKALEELIS